jgi:hypothetical protein
MSAITGLRQLRLLISILQGFGALRLLDLTTHDLILWGSQSNVELTTGAARLYRAASSD